MGSAGEQGTEAWKEVLRFSAKVSLGNYAAIRSTKPLQSYPGPSIPKTPRVVLGISVHPAPQVNKYH